ncbi:hypothetical protein TSAR_007441, partial [Trichomalopsis sarcophagae]
NHDLVNHQAQINKALDKVSRLSNNILQFYKIHVEMNKYLALVFFAVMIAMVFGCEDDLCPRVYNPVCDNLGITHINPCLFKCAAEDAKASGTELTIVKYEEC